MHRLLTFFCVFLLLIASAHALPVSRPLAAHNANPNTISDDTITSSPPSTVTDAKPAMQVPNKSAAPIADKSSIEAAKGSSNTVPTSSSVPTSAASTSMNTTTTTTSPSTVKNAKPATKVRTGLAAPTADEPMVESASNTGPTTSTLGTSADTAPATDPSTSNPSPLSPSSSSPSSSGLPGSKADSTISYGALRHDEVPCDRREGSYSNCQAGRQANPYSRSCEAQNQCRGA